MEPHHGIEEEAGINPGDLLRTMSAMSAMSANPGMAKGRGRRH